MRWLYKSVALKRMVIPSGDAINALKEAAAKTLPAGYTYMTG